MNATFDLVPLFVKQFERCNLKAGEVAAVLSEPESRPGYADAAMTAANLLGAEVFEIRVPRLGWKDVPTMLTGIAAAVPALSHASPRRDLISSALAQSTFVVDVTRETITHVPLRGELQRAGVRIQTISERPDILERMAPTDAVKEQVTAVGERLVDLEELRLTSPAGTDLVYHFEKGPVIMQWGIADEPGRWDNWPGAIAARYPADGGVSGRVVFDHGDILCHMKTYVNSPVALTIEQGFITGIEGGLDAALIRSYFESWNQPELYAISHIGFGLHPNARWSAAAFHDKDETNCMDARSFMGNFLFSTGPNHTTGRYVDAHMDVAMRGCTVALNSETFIKDGIIVS